MQYGPGMWTGRKIGVTAVRRFTVSHARVGPKAMLFLSGSGFMRKGVVGILEKVGAA